MVKVTKRPPFLNSRSLGAGKSGGVFRFGKKKKKSNRDKDLAPGSTKKVMIKRDLQTEQVVKDIKGPSLSSQVLKREIRKSPRGVERDPISAKTQRDNRGRSERDRVSIRALKKSKQTKERAFKRLSEL